MIRAERFIIMLAMVVLAMSMNVQGAQDFYVVDGSLSVTDPTPTIGDTVVLQVAFGYTGDYTDSAYTEVYVDDPRGEDGIMEKPYHQLYREREDLQSGTTVVVTFNWTVDVAPGAHLVYFMIDPPTYDVDGMSTEVDESNNVATMGITVMDIPGTDIIYRTKDGASDYQAMKGELVTVYAHLQNIRYEDGLDVTMRLSVPDSLIPKDVQALWEVFVGNESHYNYHTRDFTTYPRSLVSTYEPDKEIPLPYGNIVDLRINVYVPDLVDHTIDHRVVISLWSSLWDEPKELPFDITFDTTDNDDDDIPDVWEYEYGLDPFDGDDRDDDPDDDGLSNLQEFNFNTDPLVFDTDEDGVADATDNCRLLSNGVQTDMDGDGVGIRCDDDNPFRFNDWKYDANVGFNCVPGVSCVDKLLFYLNDEVPTDIQFSLDVPEGWSHETIVASEEGVIRVNDTDLGLTLLPEEAYWMFTILHPPEDVAIGAYQVTHRVSGGDGWTGEFRNEVIVENGTVPSKPNHGEMDCVLLFRCTVFEITETNTDLTPLHYDIIVGGDALEAIVGSTLGEVLVFESLNEGLTWSRLDGEDGVYSTSTLEPRDYDVPGSGRVDIRVEVRLPLIGLPERYIGSQVFIFQGDHSGVTWQSQVLTVLPDGPGILVPEGEVPSLSPGDSHELQVKLWSNLSETGDVYLSGDLVDITGVDVSVSSMDHVVDFLPNGSWVVRDVGPFSIVDLTIDISVAEEFTVGDNPGFGLGLVSGILEGRELVIGLDLVMPPGPDDNITEPLPPGVSRLADGRSVLWSNGTVDSAIFVGDGVGMVCDREGVDRLTVGISHTSGIVMDAGLSSGSYNETPKVSLSMTTIIEYEETNGIPGYQSDDDEILSRTLPNFVPELVEAGNETVLSLVSSRGISAVVHLTDGLAYTLDLRITNWTFHSNTSQLLVSVGHDATDVDISDDVLRLTIGNRTPFQISWTDAVVTADGGALHFAYGHESDLTHTMSFAVTSDHTAVITTPVPRDEEGDTSYLVVLFGIGLIVFVLGGTVVSNRRLRSYDLTDLRAYKGFSSDWEEFLGRDGE